MPTIVGWVYRMGVVAGLSVGVAITLPAPTSGDWVASRVADDGVALATVGQVGGAVYAVAADGSYAYAGIGPRLVAIDVSDPLHPLEVGRTEPSPWLVQGVAVADGYAYAVGSESAHFAGDGGMRIVAISDPTTPREVGVLATDWPHAPAWPEGVVAKDGYVYVALANAGLRVVDASDPRQPREVAQYQPGGAVWSVATAGDVLAAAVCGSAPDEPRGLFLLDIADAGQPRELARLSMQDCPSAVALADHYSSGHLEPGRARG
jgi:hypothetical protein